MKRELKFAGFLFALFVCLAFGITANAEDMHDINDYTIKLSATEYIYNTRPQTPKVTVFDENGEPLSNEFYSAIAENPLSADAGTYSVRVTGNESMGINGTAVLNYTINPRSFDNNAGRVYCSDKTIVYEGRACTTSVTVKCYGLTLTEGVDYKLSYKNNDKCGMATVVAEGLGNFTGSASAEYEITVAAPSSSSYSNRGLTSLKLQWSSVIGADGYTIYKFNENTRKFVLFKTVNGRETSCKLEDLTQGTAYCFRVCAFYNNEGKCGESGFSPTCYAYTTIPKYASGVSFNRGFGSREMTLKYGRYVGCSGYEFQYTFDPAFKTGIQRTYNMGAEKNSIKMSKLRIDRSYYVRVRLFLKVNGKFVYGPWSTVLNDGASKFEGSVSINKNAYSSSMGVSNTRQYIGDGYQVAYSTSSNFSSDVRYYTAKGMTKTYRSIENLTRNKGYYVKMRTYVDINGSRYYGSWSNVENTGYKYTLETYSSNYVNNADRTTNLRVASRAIDGTVILPGRTFDFNDVVGPRTSARGYKKATVFTGTKGTAQELGGGICQVASTVFNTCLYSNVKITERHQHSQKVSYVPLGRDAAISGSSKNFRWTNDKNYPIRMEMSVSGGKISCTFKTIGEENPGNIKLSVSKSGNTYTLKRYHNGSVNYSCTSKY